MDAKLIATKIDREKLIQRFGKDCLVTPFADETGAIVVAPMRPDQLSNAVLVDVLGERLAEVQLPSALKGGIGFADAYYVKDELTAIYVYAGRDFACVVDEKTGAIARYYETR